jgi:SulP family sulfate permease
MPLPAELETGNLLSELKAIADEPDNIEALVSSMHPMLFTPGEYLIRQGDEPDTIYFISTGQVTAQLESPGKAPVRLETMGGGRAVGELGFYLGIPRTAAVIIDEPSVIFSLTRSELLNLEKTDPEAANLFHRIIVHLLGERVVHLIRAVQALER